MTESQSGRQPLGKRITEVNPAFESNGREESMNRNRAVGTVILLIATLALGRQLAAQHPISPHAIERLKRDVHHELVMLPYYSVFDNLEYQINGYEVTLSGQVTRPTLKSDAESVVRNIEGVENIVNRIEVLPPSPVDDEIRRAVFFTLYSERSPLFRYGWSTVPPIHIIVKAGRVTLVGVVDNITDKNTAALLVNQVPGIFLVTNNLRVEKS
jgi:hyperosmotically inducible protein